MRQVRLKGKSYPLPSGATVEITDDTWVAMGDGAAYRLLTYRTDTAEIVFEVRDRIPGCVSIKLVAGENAIRAKDLLAIKLDRIRDEVYAFAGVAGFTPDGTDDYEQTGSDAVRAVRRITRRKITPDFLCDVAEVHRAAPEGSRLAAVQAAFHVYERQALRYIAKARKEGLI
ncbi:hypothetical protein [Mycobacterium sp. 050134]|uniref:hypothetical protein n=1 Tax=Mycobacterium sp. 050134 TaxID=3096111 RepID=UPI002ED9156C